MCGFRIILGVLIGYIHFMNTLMTPALNDLGDGNGIL